MENLKVGQEVEFRYFKNGKWHSGRIDRVEPAEGSKLIYSIEVFRTYQQLNVDAIVKGIEKGRDRHFIDMGENETFVKKEGWHFIRWFSKDYVRAKS